MNKNIILVVIAVVLVSFIGAIVYLKDDWTDPINPGDPTLDAEIKQSVILYYSDGTTETIDNSDILHFYRSSKQIMWFSHVISIKLNSGADSMVVSSLSVGDTNLKIYKGTTLVLNADETSGIEIEKTFIKGEGFVEYCNSGSDAGLWATYYNNAQKGAYTFVSKFYPREFEYTINGVSKTIPELDPITFDVYKP